MARKGETPEEEAARRAGDPDHLMKGEDPTTTFLEDARHWRDVYAELLHFKHDIIDLTENRLENLPEPAADEIAQTDATILYAERRRLENRYKFWDERYKQLEAAEAAAN